jgi:heme/copper-type cytochrome/quinol oxidase subunit 2
MFIVVALKFMFLFFMFLVHCYPYNSKFNKNTKQTKKHTHHQDKSENRSTYLPYVNIISIFATISVCMYLLYKDSAYPNNKKDIENG